jgi:hypothetical protein
MRQRAVPVQINVIGSDEVAPGFTNYKLQVSKSKTRPKALKIDDRFAELFRARIAKEATRMAAFTRKSPQPSGTELP